MAAPHPGRDDDERPGLRSRQTWISGGVALLMAATAVLYVANRESDSGGQAQTSASRTPSDVPQTSQTSQPSRTPQTTGSGAGQAASDRGG
jgi:hypothetical protein